MFDTAVFVIIYQNLEVSIVDWKKIFSVFDGAINIEKAYKVCDKAIGVLKKYEKNPDAFKGAKKEEMEESVQEAHEEINKLLDKEGEKSWPGVFREMHENLANMYMYEGKYEKTREQCEALKTFGEVGKLDAEDIMKELAERENSTEENNTEETEKEESPL